MNAIISDWIDVGALEDVPVRGSRIVKTAAGCIAIFRTTENETFALEDRCPHKGGPLSSGIVHGRSVTCPLHNWVISLETGEAQGDDEGCTNPYQVRVENGRMLMDRASLFARSA